MNIHHSLWLVLIAGFIVGSCASTKEPNLKAAHPAPSYSLDKKQVLQRLSESIRYPTVSLEDTTEINYASYEEFIKFLKHSYPNLHETAERERIGEYSLLFKWEGSQVDLKPALFMGHYDVVPISEGADSLWQYDPFSGEIAEGFVWDRGALDDKSGIMSVVEAVEYLIKQGFQPQRILYLALHHDEEVGGERGAKRVGNYLDSQGVELEFLMDEGLPIGEEIIDNIDVPLAMIGVAEKGSVNIELTYTKEGGHSSMPPRPPLSVL